MSINNYLSTSDVTSTVLKDFTLSGYIERTNKHIDSMAYSYGVDPSGMVSPYHYMIIEYGIAYCNNLIAEDKIGANNNDIGATDKYLILKEVYGTKTEKLRNSLTPFMFDNDADSTSELSAGTILAVMG